MKAYTAFVTPTGNEASYFVADDWSAVARKHNAEMLGQPLHVITNDSPGYKTMLAAASVAGGDCWTFRTLASYLAAREFAESDGPDDELFIWLDADLIVNPLWPTREWLSRRGVMVATQVEHLRTVHEHYKVDYMARHLGIDKSMWFQILTSLMLLERGHLRTILNALHEGGYDLFDPSVWEKIATGYDLTTYPHSRFYSDQAFEFAYLLAGIAPQSVMDLASWVSYDAVWDNKPLIHFDGSNKTRLPGWLDGFGTTKT